MTEQTLFQALILFILLCASAAIAQQPIRYERKSISSPDILLISDPSAQLPQEMADYLQDRIKDAVEISRFDYNPLPDGLIGSFTDRLSEIGSTDIDDIIALLDEEIVGEIERVLIEDMDRRAAGLVSPEERASWAVSKARTLGITTEEIDKVLNSAYIYFPLITGYERKVSDGSVTVTLVGTVLWYNVGLVGENRGIRLISGKRITSSKGFGWYDPESNTVTADINRAERTAYVAAADNFARNMQVALRQIPAFMIRGTLREIGFNHVSFDLGTREGIHLDDRYIITQFVEDAEGGIFTEEIGFVEVSRVGFNGTPGLFASEEPDTGRMTFSEARIVRGQGFDEGMNMVEFPRLGINIAIGVENRTVEYSASDNEMLFTEDDQTKTWFGGRGSVNYNTARWSGISHLYTTFDLHFGFATIDAKNSADESVSVGTYWGFTVGIMKKIPFRALSIPINVSFVFQRVSFDVKGFSPIGSYSARNTVVGATFATGLEYAIGPAFSATVDVGWNLFAPSDEWSLYDEDGDRTETFIGPEWDNSGMMIGISVVYMPPTLPFDPWNLINHFIQIKTR